MPRPLRFFPLVVRALAWAVGLAAAGYAACVAVAWVRYGHASGPTGAETDPLLDRFIPAYEVVERHEIHVRAPADVTMAAARDMDLLGPPVARAIFRAREIALGSRSAERRRAGVIALTTSMGWGVLAEVPGREIVMGAVTQPWEANVTFRSLPPGEFATFSTPGYVKIAWTLRADPVDATTSVFRTETRVATTDGEARKRFRRYWSFVSPGIWLIRRLALGPVKADAELRAAHARPETP